jgi:hypothetical protein
VFYLNLMKLFKAITIISLIFLSIAAYGQEKTVLKADKVAVPPVIDGSLDEEIWKNTPGISGFKTWNPDYGKDMPYNSMDGIR